MRHSLETRVPLLDHQVVEHALKLPLAAVFQRGTGKVAFRQVAAELLPETVLLSPKQGFGLQRPPSQDGTFLAREARHLESGVLVRRSIIQRQALADLLARRNEGRNPNRIWLLFALDLWLAAHHD
jgi:asparagine synthase (glutamine-hydrolysing)